MMKKIKAHWTKVCNAQSQCTIVDIDAANKKVVFYPVVFDSVDSWDRAYNSKSFNRTIKNNNYTYPHLQEHDPKLIIGKTIEMTVDNTGLKTVTQIANTTLGVDAFELYIEEIYKYHSFMGWVVQSESQVVNGKSIEYVTEVALEEVTTTLNPANYNASLINIENAIRNGKLNLNQLNTLLGLNDNSNSDNVEAVDSDLLDFIKNY